MLDVFAVVVVAGVLLLRLKLKPADGAEVVALLALNCDDNPNAEDATVVGAVDEVSFAVELDPPKLNSAFANPGPK